MIKSEMKLISLTKIGYLIAFMSATSFLLIMMPIIFPRQQSKVEVIQNKYVAPQNIIDGAERCRGSGGTPRMGMCFKDGVAIDIYD